jgi:hypothetical protein
MQSAQREVRMLSRPVLYAFAAMCLYAIQNVILEVRLSKYSTLGLLVYWYFTLAPLALAGLGYLYLAGQSFAIPKGQDAVVAILVGVLFFVADLFYVGAYTGGGSLLAITTLVVLFPAIAQLIKLLWVGGQMNYYHVVGYILAAVAVVLISKGSAAV